MNRAGLNMIQADSLEQVQGQSVYPLVAEEHREAFKALVQDVFQGKSGALEFKIIGLKGRPCWLYSHAVPLRNNRGDIVFALSVTDDITQRKLAEEEREKIILELKDAIAKVKQLSGMLPICAGCKKIRDDKGYWNQIEIYIRDHSEAEFTHGLCPDCARKAYEELDRLKKEKDKNQM
ncbi:MAG: PAS domain-containing protein [Candidatus Omnitrophica bacterium]|nr:PAS domain-containing protein [Candidatus Omnitrophota bacterium]MBI5206101.1 PAS domain-containing protein [Nitrospirota bacterium]